MTEVGKQAVRDAADAWAREHGCRDIFFCCQTPLAAFDAGVKAERERIRKLAEDYDAVYPVDREDEYGGEYQTGVRFAELLTDPEED